MPIIQKLLNIFRGKTKGIFQDKLKKAERGATQNTAKSRQWVRNKASQMTGMTAKSIMTKNRGRLRSVVEPGKMYMFVYDPKYKETLPYYDRFPLIFPIDVSGGYILGLNLHYLGYMQRAQLMDALYTLTNDTTLNADTKLKISYEVLKGSAQFKLFKPCVKKYLLTHVRSKFLPIDANEWDMALMLPIEGFEKASKQTVFSDSAKIASGR